MELLELFAQGPPSSLGGEAGWVGTGLLGAVLGWLLFFHLPAKDKQIKDFSDGKDKHISDLTEKYEAKLSSVTSEFRQEMTDSKREFKEALNLILSHCEKETREIGEVFRSELSKVHAALTEGRS